VRSIRRLLVPFALCLLPLSSGADKLEMRDGRLYEGHYKGGTPEAVYFEVDGSPRSVPIGEVRGVVFGPREAGAPGAPQAGAAPAAARVPAGTRLRVRLSDTLDPRSNVEGDRFAALLEMELQFDGRALVPVESQAFGKISEIGPTGAMSLELTGLQIGKTVQPLTTGSQQLAQAAAGAPAAQAPAGDRIPAGTLLEFRLLQPFDVPLH
jgi:hypothetical protein